MKKWCLVFAVLMVLFINFAFAKEYKAGDVDGNGNININDPVFLLNYLFKNGPKPPCGSTGDANSDGVTDITDPLFLLNYLFLGGEEPVGIMPDFACDSSPNQEGIISINNVPNNIQVKGDIVCKTRNTLAGRRIDYINQRLKDCSILAGFETRDNGFYAMGCANDGVEDVYLGGPKCAGTPDPMVVFTTAGVEAGDGGSYIVVSDESDFALLGFVNLADEGADTEGIPIKGGEGVDVIEVKGDMDFLDKTGEIHGGAGNDMIEVKGNMHFFRGKIYGDEGNDEIFIRQKISYYDGEIHGDGGNDVINVQYENFVKGKIHGDGGNDVIFVNKNNYGQIYGDEGNDVIIVIEAIDVPGSIRGGGEIPDIDEGGIHGDGGNDLIQARTNWHAEVYGDEGNDLIQSYTNRDGKIYGGGGNDVINTENYRLDGQIYGDEGDDFLIASGGTLKGGNGGDFILGGLEKEEIESANGNDIIIGDWDISKIKDHISFIIVSYTFKENSGKKIDANDFIEEIRTKFEKPIKEDILSGNIEEPKKGGDDILFSGGGEDNSDEEDNDIVFGMGGSDKILGHDGDDWLFGGSGKDVIWGGLGNDVLAGGDGDDELKGEESGLESNVAYENGFDILCGQKGKDVLYNDDFSKPEADNFMATGPRGADNKPETVFCNPKRRGPGFDTIALFDDHPPEDEVKECIINFEAFGISASSSG